MPCHQVSRRSPAVHRACNSIVRLWSYRAVRIISRPAVLEDITAEEVLTADVVEAAVMVAEEDDSA